MDVNANSQSSLSTDLNHPQVAIAEKLGNSSSIVGSTSEECLVSDNIHGSASDMLYDGDGSDGEDVDGDDVGDDDYDEQYDDLYDDNDYDYMFDNSDDENNKKKQKVSDDDYLSMQLQFDNVDLPTGVEASVPDFANIDTKASASRRRAIPANFSSNAKEGTEKELDAVQKYLTFKRFDIVDDFSDHRYLKTLHGTQPTPAWKKKIQDEWKILQNNLPDTIYVRVCEGRMDLLRAVIIGPTGTPYHDGLFVFDIHFPSNYPSVPPLVTYHSGGLRINPNLYNSGKVCLSLLNTWQGQGNEKWLPNKSTMLQVLVSIQALILNAEPYFNEPGFHRVKENMKSSKKYSEDAFILSLRTMMYTLKNPPKHFEDFVTGHFRVWGRVILIACRAYMEGAVLGSDVKGKIEDSDKADVSQLQGFKKDVATILNKLVESFVGNGSTDCEDLRLAD
ncbi:putative ubiquitin-conjugating enzyme E2 38 [Apium graveolens]|uniref:putative ubiquitin-conjugating enzyme E2 38 n=1 Tax=Apium graveolens TaxID=4045 RepID=UPI003D78E570